MNRREFLASSVAVGTIGVAGCSGDGSGGGPTTGDRPDDGTGDTGSTATTATDPGGEATTGSGGGTASVVVGERVDGKRSSMVVTEVRRTGSLGQYQRAGSGNEYVVVRLAVKNTTADQFFNFSSFLQTRLVDDEDYAYDRTFATTGQSLAEGELAPGEVTRGDVVFEVPEDAGGLALEFDFEGVSVFDLDRVTVDLSETVSSPQDVSQNLAVSTNAVGDGVTQGGTSVVVNGVETADSLGQYVDSEQGKEFLVVDVSVTNDTGEPKTVSVALQMGCKDGDGFGHDLDLVAYGNLDRAFAQGNKLADGDTRRGKVPYEVPEGRSPLYFTFEFAVFANGDKTFWTLR